MPTGSPGRIAQLVRAPASHAGGPWFESTCDHFHLEARAVLARLRRAALLRCPKTPVGRRARSRARPPGTDGRLARVAFRVPATVTGALTVAASVHGRPLGARRVPCACDRHGCARGRGLRARTAAWRATVTDALTRARRLVRPVL